LTTVRSKATEQDRPVSARTAYVSKTLKHKKPLWKKWTASVSRWLHIYLSMVSFTILLFFAVTGLTLNHPDWFVDQERTVESKGQLNVKWVNSPDTSKIAKLEVVEFFRNKHQIKGMLGEFRIDDTQCALSFKGPGYFADAFVDRESGTYELSETRLGLVAVMNDLHKGRDSGKGWAWLIDVSAVLMTLVSLTGIIMIFFMKKKRVSGLMLAILGSLIAYIVWKMFVR
jgi:hypothetical protein